MKPPRMTPVNATTPKLMRVSCVGARDSAGVAHGRDESERLGLHAARYFGRHLGEFFPRLAGRSACEYQPATTARPTRRRPGRCRSCPGNGANPNTHMNMPSATSAEPSG